MCVVFLVTFKVVIIYVEMFRRYYVVDQLGLVIFVFFSCRKSESVVICIIRWFRCVLYHHNHQNVIFFSTLRMLSAVRIVGAGCRNGRTMLRNLLNPECTMSECQANFKVSFSEALCLILIFCRTKR